MAALSQTMTGQSLAPTADASPAPVVPVPTGAPNDMTDQQKMVSAWMDELSTRLKAIPNVDIAAKMQPLIDQAKAQKVPAPMSPLTSAIAAFGAPGQSTNLIEHNRNIEEAQRQKDAQLLKLQEGIISASIDQQMQEGKFKQALEQSKVLQTMKPVLDAADRARALQEFEAKETIKQQGRIALAKERGDQMRSSMVERARQMAKGLSIDDRILLAQINHIARQQEIELQKSSVFDPLSQAWTVNDFDMSEIQQRGIDSLAQWIDEHKNGGNRNTPPKTETGMVTVRRPQDGWTGQIKASQLDAFIKKYPGSTKQ